MTANLQPALHRAHLTLNECNPQAVVLDRYEVAWQKWSRHWRPADGGDAQMRAAGHGFTPSWMTLTGQSNASS